MNPYHDPKSGQFTSKGVSKTGAAPKSKGSAPAKLGGVSGAAKASKPIHKALKRPGDFSTKGGTSKEMFRVSGGSFVASGTRTKFAAEALRTTIKRANTKGSNNPYAGAAIVTQRGVFQASIGRKMFHGGSVRAQSLDRPSIGKGFQMQPAVPLRRR